MSELIDLTADSQSQSTEELNFLLGGSGPIYDQEERFHDPGCSRLPSECMCCGVSWIWAAHKESYTERAPPRSGKWLLFLDSDSVDAAWLTIIDLMAQKKLGDCAKVIPRRSKQNVHVICVYTNDHENVKEVFKVLHTLRGSDIQPGRNSTLNYKTDDATLAAVYSNNTAAERAGFEGAAARPHKCAKISKYTSMGFKGIKNVVLTLNNIGDDYQRKIVAEMPITSTDAEINSYFARLPATATEIAEQVVHAAGRSCVLTDYFSTEGESSSKRLKL